MMEKINNQHGDLLWVAVDSIPASAKKVKNLKPGYVFERGEGVHTHVLEDMEGVEVFEDGTDIYVRVKEINPGAKNFNHEEHGPQTFKKGISKKRIERVWDYESEEARKVID